MWSSTYFLPVLYWTVLFSLNCRDTSFNVDLCITNTFSHSVLPFYSSKCCLLISRNRLFNKQFINKLFCVLYHMYAMLSFVKLERSNMQILKTVKT